MALRKASNETLHEGRDRETARDEPGLVEQLRSPDATKRRWAARDLGAFPGSASVLGERVLQEPDPSVREVILTSLGQHATDAAAAVLLPLLRSEDAALRNGAIETLAAMPHASGPRIDALLRDRDPDVRIFTANLLTELKLPQVPEWLVRLIEQDVEVNVVCAAIEALAEVGSVDHLPALRGVHHRFPQEPFAGFAADVAIERIEAK